MSTGKELAKKRRPCQQQRSYTQEHKITMLGTWRYNGTNTNEDEKEHPLQTTYHTTIIDRIEIQLTFTSFFFSPFFLLAKYYGATQNSTVVQ